MARRTRQRNDALDEFMANHIHLTCYPQTPRVLDNVPETWSDFFALHDGLEETRETYRQFQREYSSHRGPFNYDDCIRLARMIPNLGLRTDNPDGNGIGDIDNLFTPLDRTILGENRGSYHLFCGGRRDRERIRQTYEQRLNELILRNQNERINEDYILVNSRDIGSPYSLPAELWQMHLLPNIVRDQLQEIMFYESLPSLGNRDYSRTRYETSWSIREREREMRETGERIPPSYLPSLRTLRRTLPEDLLDFFNPDHDMPLNLITNEGNIDHRLSNNRINIRGLGNLLSEYNQAFEPLLNSQMSYGRNPDNSWDHFMYELAVRGEELEDIRRRYHS